MRRLAHLAGGTTALLACIRVASAQPEPASTPSEPAPTVTPPLAQIRDDKQLAEALSAITQDPAIPVDDPASRPLAQALMIEGVKQLQAKAYDQALANFLEAYAKFPSPKILLNIASTLRDMGRLADAANTYQRYLLDPATGVERIAEVKELLLKLDEQLTILTVRVFPRGSDVSIDGGPFLAVGSSLQTRVRPGLHLVRVRKGEESTELTVNGFEGENKEVTAALKIAEPAPTPAVDPTVVVTDPKSPTTGTTSTTRPSVPAPAPPERVDAWLTTGTQYGSDGSGRVRQVRAGFGGPVVSAYVPAFAIAETPDVAPADPDRLTITSGLLAVARIDGQLRGAAGGLGIAISRGRFELDVMVLRSEHTGGYLGGRFRLFTGFLRPYVAVGVPGFVYEQMGATSEDAAETRLAIGVRGAAGVELVVNGHLSVQADLGYEHFFGVDDTPFEADVFVPTVGVIGRL